MVVPTGCLPRWVSPRGHATRPRRRRDSNPDHGRDRTVCSPDYTTSACRPGRNRTGDLRIQSPASLASGDSEAARRCRSPCTSVEQGFLVRSARTEPLARPGGRNERRSNRREHHRPFQPTAGGRNGRWMNAGGNPVFPRPGRVVRVGARLCGCGSPDIAGARRTLVFDAEPAILVRSLHTLTL